MTNRLYYIIDICPEKYLISVDLYLSRRVFSQYLTSEKKNKVRSRKVATRLVKEISNSNIIAVIA